MLSLSEKVRLENMNVDKRVVSRIARNTGAIIDQTPKHREKKCLSNFTWQALVYKNDSITRQYQPRFSRGDRRVSTSFSVRPAPPGEDEVSPTSSAGSIRNQIHYNLVTRLHNICKTFSIFHISHPTSR